MIEIIAVNSSKLQKEFIDFPHSLFKNDPNYVPELFLEQKELLNPKKNPFFKHAAVQLFLAKENGRTVGRVAAIWNENNNKFNHVNEGAFGFFDCINNQETCNILLDSATNWVKEKGADTLVGPINLSTNNSCGLLIQGFDSPPFVMMPYNPPYYMELLSAYGLDKKVDLRAYSVEKEKVNTRSVALLERLEERLARSGIKLRELDVKHFEEDAKRIKEVYNKAWDKNLGFVPMTDQEFDFTAKSLKQILDTKYAIIAEKEGEIIAFALGIPNINEVLIKIKRGRLFPFGIFKLLFGLKKVNSVRVLMLGVLEKYRKQGIEACLYGRIISNALNSNIEQSECSWMLEDNFLMNNAIEKVNGELYKQYRLYQKSL